MAWLLQRRPRRLYDGPSRVMIDRARLQRLLDEAAQAGNVGRHDLLHHLMRCRFATAICWLDCWISPLTCVVARCSHVAGVPMTGLSYI